jgi:hypothetical protein
MLYGLSVFRQLGDLAVGLINLQGTRSALGAHASALHFDDLRAKVDL